jgi:hypothetical protein
MTRYKEDVRQQCRASWVNNVVRHESTMSCVNNVGQRGRVAQERVAHRVVLAGSGDLRGRKIGLSRRRAIRVRSHLQRAILNFTPGPQGWTSPLGVKLTPRGVMCPLGGIFTPLFTPTKGGTLYRLEEWMGEQRISPPGDNFTPRGQNSPLGDNVAPDVKVCPKGRS